VEPVNHKIETPDKQNAYFLAASPMQMTDTDPDLAAVTIAGMVFGGSPNSRMFQRIRVKDGLSYGASAGFSVPTKDDGGGFSAAAIAAPQNVPKVEAAFNEELARALKEGFTADEVEKAKKAWLDKLEAAVAALTPQQVNDAFRRRADPAALTIVKGGDFKKAGVFQ
jgi:zinc protease